MAWSLNLNFAFSHFSAATRKTVKNSVLSLIPRPGDLGIVDPNEDCGTALIAPSVRSGCLCDR